MLVFDKTGIVNGLSLEKLILNDIGQLFLPVNIVLIFLFPGAKITDQSIKLPLPLPDDTLNIFILNSILLYSFMNVLDVGFEISQLCGL
jgi:hypothetical protein